MHVCVNVYDMYVCIYFVCGHEVLHSAYRHVRVFRIYIWVCCEHRLCEFSSVVDDPGRRGSGGVALIGAAVTRQ